MKFSYCNFIAKANVKRGKKNSTVFVLMLLSAICLLIIGTFSTVLSDLASTAKREDGARRFYISSYTNKDNYYTELTENTLAEISAIPHVQSLDRQEGIEYAYAQDVTITNEDGTEFKNGQEAPFSYLEFRSLFKTQKCEVVAGQSLDEAPVYSCLVPSLFLPYKNYKGDSYETRTEFEKGEDFIGKYITMRTDELCKQSVMDKEGLAGAVELGSSEIKLKVVGVYDSQFAKVGGPFRILISNDTSVQFEKEVLSKLPDNNSAKQLILNNENYPEKNSYTVLVDNYDNIQGVFKELNKLNVLYDTQATYAIDESTLLFCAMFTAGGNFLTVAILLLTIINIFLSVSNNILERKSEIGLFKAIGYNNKDIFFTMYLEQLRVCLRAAVIGLISSGILVAAISIYNTTGTYVNKSYVASPVTFAVFAAITLAVAVFVPLICLLIMVRKITNAEAKDAMEE